MVMKEDLEKREGSIWIPFLVGGVVGAGIALLFAPKSGRELRKDIKDVAVNTRDRVAATVERGKELYVDSTAAVKSAFEAGKAAYVQELEKHRPAA